MTEEKQGLEQAMNEVLSTLLTDREQRVLQLRFGLEDGRSRTLVEVGKEFDVTRERIRQIEAKALRKLRYPSRSRKLKDFLVEKSPAYNLLCVIFGERDGRKSSQKNS